MSQNYPGCRPPYLLLCIKCQNHVKKSKIRHRNSVLNLQLDVASVMVINCTMSVWVTIAILLTYCCSAPITLPWVQQWRSDTFSPALECQTLLPPKWQILSTGCWHTHNTKLFLFQPASSSSTFGRSTFTINLTLTCLLNALFLIPSLTARQGLIPPTSFRVGIRPHGR